MSGFFCRGGRFALALAGIALLAFAIYDSALRGIEDWRSARARHDIGRWSEGRSMPSMEQWQRTVDELRAALRLAPADPVLWEYLGLAYEFGSRKFLPAGGWTVYSEFALVHYRRASVLRPTSPYASAGIALMKYRFGQLDEEFDRAFASAMRLGPWEHGVQLITAELGLALWDRLNPALKDQVRENWRRTSVRQAEQLAKLAIRQGRAAVLCKEALEALKKRLECP